MLFLIPKTTDNALSLYIINIKKNQKEIKLKRFLVLFIETKAICICR